MSTALSPIRKRLPLPVKLGAESIPEEMRTLPQWVAWGREPGDKVPVNPHSGRNASTNDPTTWATFEEATNAVRRYGLRGVGFVFTANDPFVGVDLDKCIDTGTGVLEPWAQEIVNNLDSFTEKSLSGTGLHIIVKGKWPAGQNRKHRVEVYDRSRFFTVTGDVVNMRRTIEERTPELDKLRLKHFGPVKVRQKIQVKPVVNITSGLTDEAIIEKARNSASNEKFSALWTGAWQGLFPSPSEAVLSLLNMLVRYAGRDRERVDRLFRQSGLFNEKWDSKRGDTTYGEQQLDLALGTATCPEAPPASLDLGNAIISFRDLEKMDLPQQRHLLRPWLPEASLNLISAEAGTGKTFFALEVAGACAEGRPAMAGNWVCTQGAQVLYVDGEMLPSEIRARGQLLGVPESFKLLSKMLYEKANPNHTLNLASPAIQDWLLRQAVAMKVRLLVLDNIYSLIHGLDSNSDREWQPVNTWLLRLKAEGIAVLIIHHSNKKGEQLGTSSRVFNLDTHLVLKKLKNPPAHAAFSIEIQKSRHQLKGIDEYEYELKEGKWEVSGAKSGNNKVGGIQRDVALGLVDGNSQKEIAESLGCSSAYVNQIKASLIAEGTITQDKVGKKATYSLTERGQEWVQQNE